MTASLTALLLAVVVGGGTDDVKALQGRWKVTAAFEDGQALSERDIATHLFADGTITIDGPVISFQAPGAFEPRKLAFTVNAKAEPRAINLVGGARRGSRGIYLVSADSLMVCLSGPKEPERPRDFGADKGSGRLLLVLKRAPAKAVVAVNTVPAPLPQLPAAPTVAEEMRKALIGTWGHQSDDAVYYYTLNADGTFGAVVEWKKFVKRTFNDDLRASGTWKLVNGVIIVTLTTSTEANLRGQVLSWRVTNLGASDLIAVDGQGRTRHEWRVR
jgi:uncharacterized protein (TIGR03067 family)